MDAYKGDIPVTNMHDTSPLWERRFDAGGYFVRPKDLYIGGSLKSNLCFNLDGEMDSNIDANVEANMDVNIGYNMGDMDKQHGRPRPHERTIFQLLLTNFV
ncbi:hypothetical protein L915_06721 [Phytophthora nicotianae]|uniref:Uncharacterized protein n=1 Tax=Phytophthora nicotianae TaxID=4792 RepID=W2H1R3_PHYNI|nr:hypothetical protein L915_06721 [Phytophthora nicotianae]